MAIQSKPSPLNYDEAHWAELAKRVNDPMVAGDIIQFLELYPNLRARHGGLYLLASEVVRRKKLNDLATALKQRQAYSTGKALGKCARIAYRVLRLGVRGAIALYRMVHSNVRWHQAQKQIQKQLQAEHKAASPTWAGCPKCGAPVGVHQQRCDECGHVLKATSLIQQDQEPVSA